MPSTSEFLAVAASLAVAGGLTFASPTPEPTPAPAPIAPQGYLGERAPDTIAILPPAPKAGSPVAQADRRIFLATRALRGRPRWTLAINDVAQSPSAMLKDFGCALGVEVTPETAPKVVNVMRRAGRDIGPAVNRPKDLYNRQRPYLIDDGEICVPKSDSLAKSPDYPSGHATWGWMWGLILAEMAPDRAGPILARARAYGESRAVCGVHNASSVDAGRTNASALVAALHGEAEYRADVEAGRAELAALRAAPGAPPPTNCEAEAALIAKTPW